MKQLLVFLFLLCAASVSAQDVIVKKDGSTILSKVLEVGQNEIKYKKYDNVDGPIYTIKKSELQSINYQNGAKDTFSAPVSEDNRYLPNNQNDGTQQYNDRALLLIDKASHNPKKKANKQLLIGLLGGGIIGGVGIATSAGEGGTERGAIFGGIGVAWAAAWTLSAIPLWKEAKGLQSYSLFQKDFPANNSSTLSFGADLLRDNTLGQNTIGLGLRYNF